MKPFALATLILMLSAAAAAQHLLSSRLPDDIRYEMVQVPWDKATTFRLDKYRGIVHRLGTCAKDDGVGGNKCWREMIVLDLPRGGSTRPHFQIVIDGLLKVIFLLDADTGLSWQYALDPSEKWHPFVDCADRTNPQCLWRPLP